MEEGSSPRLGSCHSAAAVVSDSPRSHGAKDYREEIRNKRQMTVIRELQAQESLDALPIRMSEAGTLRRSRPNSNNLAPYKITIVGPNDGSEAELVSAFVNSDGAPQLASPLSQRGDKEESGGSGASQEAVDLYLSSWKKKFNFAGKEYLLELHAGLQTQAETALDKGANVHIHDQFESSAGFMFLYDVTSRETFAEVMRVHSLIVRSKNVEKGKAKGLIPMIVLANTRNSHHLHPPPAQPPLGGDSPSSSSSSHHPVVSVTAPDGSDVALSASVTLPAGGGDTTSTTTPPPSPEREVATEEGLEFAYACNCPFYEISSTTNYADVLNAFQQLLGEIIKSQRTRQAAADPASKLTQLGVKGNWRRSQLASLVSSASSSSYGVSPPLSPPLSPLSSPPPRPRIEPVLPGSARGVDDDSAAARAVATKAHGGLLTPTTTTLSSSEVKEDLHESLKDRQKAFRYTRVDTAEIKYLPPLDAEPNSKPRIRAATLPKLIEKLTYPKYPDTDLVATFLLTYRSFTTPEELLHFVMRRYEITAPADLDKEDLRLWEASEMLPIRLRVINVLKSWISDHFYDFYDSKTLLDTLKDFVDKQLSVPTNLKGPLQQLRKSIETNEMERRARKEYMFSSKPPKSVISKKVAKAKPQEIDLRDIDPIEMARQLTLIDYDLLSRITAKEWLAHNEWATNKAKKRDDESRPAAPNLVAMINHFNCVSKWVATEIVKCAKIKHRVLLTKKFIEVAQHCLKLNNFNMLMAIVTGGLGNVSVYRLKYSWKSLPKKTLIAYEELRTLCDSLSNFNSLRTAIRTSVPPTIPYLGLYLSDLMYIEDGNADEVEGGLINFEKRRLKAEIIKDLQHFQTSPYCLTEIPVLQYYFRSLDHLSEAELYRMSCLLEPHSRQRGASIVNAPARGMADQLTTIDLLESSDGEIQVRRDSSKHDPDGAVDRAARAQGVSSDEDLQGRDGGPHALSSSPPPSSPFAQMTRAGGGGGAGGFTPSGLMLSHFDVPLRPKARDGAATGERDTERTPRVGAVLRAQAKLLEAVAATFSFADVARATAAVDVLRRWEAQVAARKLFIVKDHSDFAGLDGDDDSGGGGGGGVEPKGDNKGDKGDNNNVDGQQRKQSGSKRKERARGEIKGEKSLSSSKLGQPQPQPQPQGTEEEQHHRTFGFEEVLMESRAVELAVERFLQTATVEGILEATRADPIGGGWLAAFEAFLHKRLLGGQRPAFVTELLFALVKLLDKGPACFDAAAVAGMVGLYKKQPVRLAAHFVTDEAEAELADRHDRLIELEDREGGRTIQSYTKEVRLAFQILNLEKRILQTVKTSRPDGSMLYEALCVDREVWHRTQEVLLHTHSPKSPTTAAANAANASEASGGRTGETTHKIIGELIQLVDKHLSEVSREDMQRFNESFEDALEEYFGWMGVYLRKLWDKLVLIHKRTEKIVQMKESAATAAGNSESTKDSNAISKAANAWREKDLVHLHALIAAVDQAETTINKFLESCPASSADGFDVTEDELKELLSQNNVFEQIIKMRRLQKTLEEQQARIADM